MENDVINAFMALNDIDDELVSETADPKKRRAANFLLPSAVAAAAIGALVLAAVLINRPKKDDVSALMPENSPQSYSTNAPMATADTSETAEPTREPYAYTTGEPSVPTNVHTGEPTEEVSAQPTYAQPTYAQPTGGSSATAQPTGAPEPTPRPTSAPTAASTDVAEPTGTQPYTPIPTPHPTEAPTSAPTTSPTTSPTPRPTATHVPVPTPVPTQIPTGEPTFIPEPSFDPTPAATMDVGPSVMTFYCIMDFVDAVRSHIYLVLDGIDCYYTYPEDADITLSHITVNYEEAKYFWVLPNGKTLYMEWFRGSAFSQNLYNYIIENNSGNWHSDLYVYGSSTVGWNAVKMDAGRLLMFSCPNANFSEDEFAGFCRAERNPI